MSGVVFSKGVVWVPRNDREFVQQATRPFAEVLGIQDRCKYAEWLEKDHQGIANMCKEALVPVLVPKTNKDYGYSMLYVGVLAAGGAAALALLTSSAFKNLLTSGTYKTVLIGAVIGTIVGAGKVYVAPEKDLKETEIQLKARTERNWLKSKQPQIEAKLKEAEEKVEKFALEDFDKNDENKDTVRTRDQLLLLKSYVESAVGNYRAAREV